MNKSPLDDWIEEKHHIDMEDRRYLEHWQLQQFNYVVQYARENAPFYRTHLRGGGPITSLKELGTVPLMDSHHISAAGNTMICVPQGEIERIVTLDTTGTTAAPKRIYFTREDQGLTIDFFCHGISTLVFPGQKVCIFLPGAQAGSVGDLLSKGLVRLGAYPIPSGIITNVEDGVEILKKEQPDVLVGIPIQILALAQYCHDHRVTTKVTRILLSTDFASDSLIHRIEALLKCEVFNHYGMTETGLGGAVDCEAHEGMHIRETDLLFEAVHPVTGEVQPAGVVGELVFTTLTRTGMPLIRYRTGDYGCLCYETCKCGSNIARIKSVGPRIGDFLVVDGKRITITELDEIIFALEGVVDYRVSMVHKGEVRCEIIDRLLPYTGKRQLIR